MKYYWNEGFYIDWIHFQFDPVTGEYEIPGGCVEITEELYHELLIGQQNGKRIVTGEDGLPLLVDPQPQQPNPVAVANQVFRTLQIKVAAMSLPADDDKMAKQLAPICPTWAAGQHYKALEIVNHEGVPYRVIQDVDALEHQAPGTEGMLAIYRPIDPAPGTLEEPKRFYFGMDVTKDLYYTHNGKVYLAKSDMPACVYEPGSEGVWQWEEVETL